MAILLAACAPATTPAATPQTIVQTVEVTKEVQVEVPVVITPTPAPLVLAPGTVDTSQYKKDPPWTIARAGAGEVNDWMVSLSAHYQYAIEEKYQGLFANYYTTGANFDPAKQIADIEDLLAKDPDLLIIEPVSQAALVASVEKAMNQGVPVILSTNLVPTDNYVTYISTDNVKVGYTMAEGLAKRLDGKGKIIVLLGIAGSSYAEDNELGIRRALANYPDMEIVGLCNCNWSVVEAKTATEAYIQANPQIDGIISGGLMGLGAVDAFLDAGRPVPLVVGDDWNAWLRKAKELDLKFFAVDGGSPMGLWAVDLAVQILRGEPVPKYVEFPYTTFDETKLDEYFRPDLKDSYWGNSLLPENWVEKLYKP